MDENDKVFPDEQPPEGYIPQAPLPPDYTPGVYARPSDPMSDIENEEVSDDEAAADGVADDDDDNVVDDESA
jgi:hypothetical protein